MNVSLFIIGVIGLILIIFLCFLDIVEYWAIVGWIVLWSVASAWLFGEEVEK